MGNSCPCRRCEKVPRKTVTLFMGGGDSNRIFAHHNYSIGSQPPAQTFPPCFVTAPQPGALDWEFCKSLGFACPAVWYLTGTMPTTFSKAAKFAAFGFGTIFLMSCTSPNKETQSLSAKSRP